MRRRHGGIELDLVVDLVKSMAVVIVVAYLFTRTQAVPPGAGRPAREAGAPAAGAHLRRLLRVGHALGRGRQRGIANTRDLGPALGGLIGGPVVGIGAGLIGGLQRLAMGGWTAVPSALGAVAAGAAGGVVFLLYKRRVAPVWAAMLLARLHGVGASWASTSSWPSRSTEALATGPGRDRPDDPRQRRRHGPVRVHRPQRGARARDRGAEGAHGGRAQGGPRHPAVHRADHLPAVPRARGVRPARGRSSRRARSAATSTTSSCSTTTTCAWPSATSPARACRRRCSWR